MNTTLRNEPRIARVLRLHRQGLNGSEIARAEGITRQRAQQIIKRELGESTRKIRRTPCRICGVSITRRECTAHRESAEHRAGIWARRVDRFWGHVDRSDPYACWDWQGARYPTGYGSSSSSLPGSGYAHRAAYTLTRGPIPQGLTLDHLCRRPSCVNPAHLEAVTQRENTLRSPIALAAINARKTHCKHGHPFAGDNLLLTAAGHRKCRECGRIRAAAQNARRRGHLEAVA